MSKATKKENPSLYVPFSITSEINVREVWCYLSSYLGYHILRSREAFPDYKLKDEGGKIILAEAEYHLKNFLKHNHDPSECDLVVAWWGKRNVREKFKADLPVNIIILNDFVSTPTQPHQFTVQTLTIPEQLRNTLDREVRENRGFTSRSELIRDAIRLWLSNRSVQGERE